MDGLRTLRNNVIDGKGKLPAKEDAQEAIRLGDELLQIDSPKGGCLSLLAKP